MMKKRGERSVKELYDLTHAIPSPEITPVLEGSCRIQGPVDESAPDLQQANLGSVPVDQRNMDANKSFWTRGESGTCNVCSAPCSSCMHFSRTTSVMESNTKGGCTVNEHLREEADCCSYNGADVLLLHKSTACEDLQQATSATSNLASVSSSHDSYSENAESKAILAPSVMFHASEHVDMPLKVSSGEAVEGGLHQKEDVVSAHCHLSSSSHATDDLQRLSFISQNKEKQQLEFHGDNMSCLTGGRGASAINILDAEVDRKETISTMASTKSVVAEDTKAKPQVEICHIAHDGEKMDGVKLLEPSVQPKELCKRKSPDHVEFASLAINSSNGESSEYLMGKVESSSGGQLASDNIDGRNSDGVSKDQDSKAYPTKSSSSPRNPKSNSPCLPTEIREELEITSAEGSEVVKHAAINDTFEKPSTSAGTSKIQDSEKQSQQISDGENSELEIEDDVKVCDICGDAGREECLAFCSRCSDGAEHTYCMRAMTEKIPEGDWICEGCKLKEDDENQKANRTDTELGESKLQSKKQKIENSESNLNLKASPILEKEMDPEVGGVVKDIQNPKASSKKHSENLEISSMTRKRPSESNAGSLETASPRKRMALSRESSFKSLDAGKAKPSNMSTSGNHVNSARVFGQAQTSSGSNLSKVQTQLNTPRVGSLSRSFSFNNSAMKGKVKQLTESISQKPKTMKEAGSRDIRKDGPIRTMVKISSFRSVGCSTTEAVVKAESVDARCFKQLNEKSSLEKKNSFKSERNLVRSSMTNSSLPSKAEVKVSHGDGRNEVNRQLSFTSCSSDVQKPSMLPPKEGFRSSSDKSSSQHDAVPKRNADSSSRDDKAKDSNVFSSSRQVGTSGGRILRCQRCNETGHTSQFCSIDKLCVSALKPSAERNLKEWTNKSNKCKDATEAVVSKSKLKDGRLLDQVEESATVAADSSGTDSKDIPPSSLSFARNLPSFKGTNGEPEVSRSSACPGKIASSGDVKQLGVHQIQACIPQAEGSISTTIPNSDELNEKLSLPNLSGCVSLLENSLRVFAVPEFEFIWQGDFEVLRTDKGLGPCNGVQAHLSTHASPKVLEVATKFPCKVKLEEVSCLNTWPLQFQRACPKEENIALFFFARDIESYEKNYKKLMENMIKHDLALRGIVDGIELLIFPSNKLPENSQRWNNLFFLWGVFRERDIDCLETLSGLQKPCKSSFDMESLLKHSPTLHRRNTPEIPEKDLCKFERPHEEKVNECTNVENLFVSTSGDKGRICQTQLSLPDQASSISLSQLHGQLSSFPDSGIQMNTSQLCSDQKCDGSYLERAGGTNGCRGAETPDGLSKHDVLPTRLTYWTPKTGIEGIGGEHGISKDHTKEKEIQVKSENRPDDDPDNVIIVTDHISSESKSSTRHPNSYFVETPSQASGETSKRTGETMLWKEKMNSIGENDREHGKMKFYSEGNSSSSSSMSCRVSSKVHSLLASLPNEQQHRDRIYDEKMMAESLRSTKRCFTLDLNSTFDEQADNVIHVLSSDDEDTSDLDLGLGGKKKPVEQEFLPLFSSIDRRENQNKVHAETGDDASALLSLSLGFPISEKGRTSSPLLKTEQLLPERPVDTSWLLFGGFNKKT